MTQDLPEVQRPEWLTNAALKSLEDACRLVRENQLPAQLIGWMLLIPCLRVLRAIYGSDRLVIQGMIAHIDNKEREIAEMNNCPN